MNTPIADDFPAIAAGMGEDLPAGSDTSSSTTDKLTERASASLNTLDCELVDLEAASRLLGHLSTTDLEISGSELLAVQMMVERAHDQIEARYNRLRELFREQHEAHRAALAEAQAFAVAEPGISCCDRACNDDVGELNVMANYRDRAMRLSPGRSLTDGDKPTDSQPRRR